MNNNPSALHVLAPALTDRFQRWSNFTSTIVYNPQFNGPYSGPYATNGFRTAPRFGGPYPPYGNPGFGSGFGNNGPMDLSDKMEDKMLEALVAEMEETTAQIKSYLASRDAGPSPESADTKSAA